MSRARTSPTAIARTYLGNRQDAVWSYGNTNGGTASSAGAGQGYAAYGRTYTLGVSYQF